MVEKLDLEQYRPGCLLAHGLINKLAVIVGNCELIKDHAPEGSACRKQLDAIREIAKGMAEDLSRHQCAIDLATREAVQQSMGGRKPVAASQQLVSPVKHSNHI